MEIMIFIFCLLFLCHNGDSSLQFFRDVWSGKKLCVGEGGYRKTRADDPRGFLTLELSVIADVLLLHLVTALAYDSNLSHAICEQRHWHQLALEAGNRVVLIQRKCQINVKFLGCCKPYICTKIPRKKKPTLIAIFTEFMYQRCLLPSTATVPTNETYHTSILNGTCPISVTNVTEINTSDYLNGTGDQYSGVQYDWSNSAEAMVNNSYFNNEILQHTTQLYGTGGNEFTLSEENLSKNFHSKTKIKRSISAKYPSSKNNIEAPGIENTAEYSGHNNLSSSEYSESIYSDTSNSTDYSSVYEENNNTTAKYVDPSVVETNQTVQDSTTIEDKALTNNVLDKNTTTSNNISAEEIDDDWTSSDMDFDTRPTLHKVITIPPFHFFKSVEVTKINESIETSE